MCTCVIVYLRIVFQNVEDVALDMSVTFFPKKYCVLREMFEVLSFCLVTSLGLRFNSDF